MMPCSRKTPNHPFNLSRNDVRALQCPYQSPDSKVQPSSATKSTSLIGVDIVTGLIIIIPSASSTLDTTKVDDDKGK